MKSVGYTEGKLGSYCHSHRGVWPRKHTAGWVLFEVQPPFCVRMKLSQPGVLRRNRATYCGAGSPGHSGQKRQRQEPRTRWGEPRLVLARPRGPDHGSHQHLGCGGPLDDAVWIGESQYLPQTSETHPSHTSASVHPEHFKK